MGSLKKTFQNSHISRVATTFSRRLFATSDDVKPERKETCKPPKISGITGGNTDVCVYTPPISTLQEACHPSPRDPESVPPEEPPPSSPMDASIVVIGGGMAGLTAAQKLINSGLRNTIVLEASPRPGGRIKTSYLCDSVVELGASSGDSSSNPNEVPIINMALKSGLLSPKGNDPTKGLFCNCDGSNLPVPISFLAYKEFEEIMREAGALRKSADAKELALVDHFIGVRLHQVIKRMPPEHSESAARAIAGLSSYIMNLEVLADIVGAYAIVPGGIKVPLGSVGRLSQHLTDIGSQILYNKRVDKIRWGTVTPEQKPRAVVRCSDGSTYHADCVLITLPLGVLKEEWESMFCPHLPGHKISALNNLPYYSKEKIFVAWSQPLWVWRDRPLNKVFNKADLSTRCDWTKGLESISEVAGSQKLIKLVVRGSDAKDMVRLGDGDILDGVLAFLKEWLGDSCIPVPKGIMRSGWTDDPFIRGAYAVSVGGNEERILAEAVPHEACGGFPILYFAGEATSSGLCGSLQGALLSGVREADKIIAGIKRSAGTSISSEVKNPCYIDCCLPAPGASVCA